FSLLRLGGGVHGAHVIGTAVPASPESRKRPDGCGKSSKFRSPPAGNAEALSGAEAGPAGKRRRKSRSSSSATRFGSISVRKSEAGRKSDRPKKGRGTSNGFGFGQAGSVERSANLRVARSSKSVGLLLRRERLM